MPAALVAAGLVSVGAALGAAASAAALAVRHRRRGGNSSSGISSISSSTGTAAGDAKESAAVAAAGPHRSPPPHPSWTPGQKQPPPYDMATSQFIAVDPASTDKASMYALVISAVVPRPIALVSSLSAGGSRNLAPYSYFNVMGHNPPVVAIGMCRSPGRGGGKKDSLLNIEETGEFVVCIMSRWYVEAANHSCGDFPRGVDELAASGLTPLASSKVAPPRVAEAAVALECRVRTVHDVADASGAPTSAVVIGEVVMLHVAEAVAGRSPGAGRLVVDPLKLSPVCRLGGITYGELGALYDIPRPDGQGRYAASGGGGGAPAAAPAAATAPAAAS